MQAQNLFPPDSEFPEAYRKIIEREMFGLCKQVGDLLVDLYA